MQMLPVFIYTGFVFRKLFGLKKKGAVLRTLLANGLQYVYAFFAALGLLTLSLGIYYLVAPEKFKEELNIRNRDARTEQVEGSQQGEGALNDILNGFLDGLLHEDEADKSSGKDGEDTAGTRDEPQKDVPENRPETEKTAAAGDNPPAGNTAGRQAAGRLAWKVSCGEHPEAAMRQSGSPGKRRIAKRAQVQTGIQPGIRENRDAARAEEQGSRSN